MSTDFMQIALESVVQFAGEAQVLPGKIDKNVDFMPERPDEVFGLAEKTPRESLRIPTRIHSNRNDSAFIFFFLHFFGQQRSQPRRKMYCLNLA